MLQDAGIEQPVIAEELHLEVGDEGGVGGDHHQVGHEHGAVVERRVQQVVLDLHAERREPDDPFIDPGADRPEQAAECDRPVAHGGAGKLAHRRDDIVDRERKGRDHPPEQAEQGDAEADIECPQHHREIRAQVIAERDQHDREQHAEREEGGHRQVVAGDATEQARDPDQRDQRAVRDRGDARLVVEIERDPEQQGAGGEADHRREGEGRQHDTGNGGDIAVMELIGDEAGAHQRNRGGNHEGQRKAVDDQRAECRDRGAALELADGGADQPDAQHSEEAWAGRDDRGMRERHHAFGNGVAAVQTLECEADACHVVITLGRNPRAAEAVCSLSRGERGGVRGYGLSIVR